jgi:hypothetical protein
MRVYQGSSCEGDLKSHLQYEMGICHTTDCGLGAWAVFTRCDDQQITFTWGKHDGVPCPLGGEDNQHAPVGVCLQTDDGHGMMYSCGESSGNSTFSNWTILPRHYHDNSTSRPVFV